VNAREAEDASIIEVASPVQVAVRLRDREARAEDAIYKQTLVPGRWATLSFEFSPYASDTVLELIPSNCAAIIEIREVSIYSAAGTLLSRFGGAAVAACFSLSGTIASLSDSHRCLLLSYGSEPVLILRNSHENEDSPARMEVVMRVDLMEALTPAIASFVEDARSRGPRDEIDLRPELNAAKAERDALREKLAKSTAEADALKAQVEGIVKSKSWRVTAPLRRITEGMRDKH